MCLEAQLWLNWLGTTRFYQVYQTDRARTERLLVKVFKLVRFTKRTVGYPGPSSKLKLVRERPKIGPSTGTFTGTLTWPRCDWPQKADWRCSRSLLKAIPSFLKNSESRPGRHSTDSCSIQGNCDAQSFQKHPHRSSLSSSSISSKSYRVRKLGAAKTHAIPRQPETKRLFERPLVRLMIVKSHGFKCRKGADS